MSTNSYLWSTEVPAHVPTALVRNFKFEEIEGGTVDAVGAAAAAVRDLPDIFFGLGARHGGSAWVLTRNDLIREVYSDGVTFSSKGTANFSALLGESWDLLPLELDPPENGKWRALLNPLFSPSRMISIEKDIRATATELVEGFRASGRTEFVSEFSAVFPVTVFLRLLGLPVEQTGQFLEWVNSLLHDPAMEGKVIAAHAIRDYLVGELQSRRDNPRGDVISQVVNGQVDGRQVTLHEALAVCFLLFTAGLDTVTAALGFMFKHLAEHPEDQQRLRDDPKLIPKAVEEMMRAYPVVISGRLLTRDIDFHGVAMKIGDGIVMPTMFAGRDETKFAHAGSVDLSRNSITHLSFAAGPHRCLGMHLARQELSIAIQEWLSRVPAFHTDPNDPPRTYMLGLFGVDHLPLIWAD